MAQLVNERVTLINTMTRQRLDADGVREKFGVPPECIIDYLALVGDTSDNIPGVPGIGPKTAAALLGEYGSIDAMLAAVDTIKGKAGERLRDHREQLPLSRQLATIHCDVPLEQGPRELHRREPDRGRLEELYRRLDSAACWKNSRQRRNPPPPIRRQRRRQTMKPCSRRALDGWLNRLRAAAPSPSIPKPPA